MATADPLVHLDIWLTHLQMEMYFGKADYWYRVRDGVTRKELEFRYTGSVDFENAVKLILAWIRVLGA